MLFRIGFMTVGIRFVSDRSRSVRTADRTGERPAAGGNNRSCRAILGTRRSFPALGISGWWFRVHPVLLAIIEQGDPLGQEAARRRSDRLEPGEQVPSRLAPTSLTRRRSNGRRCSPSPRIEGRRRMIGYVHGGFDPRRKVHDPNSHRRRHDLAAPARNETALLARKGISAFGANHLDGRQSHERLVAYELDPLVVRQQRQRPGWVAHLVQRERFACYAEWSWAEDSDGPTAARLPGSGSLSCRRTS